MSVFPKPHMIDVILLLIGLMYVVVMLDRLRQNTGYYARRHSESAHRLLKLDQAVQRQWVPADIGYVQYIRAQRLGACRQRTLMRTLKEARLWPRV